MLSVPLELNQGACHQWLRFGRPAVASVDRSLVPLRVTARLVVLRLARGLLVGACVSAPVAQLLPATLANFVGVRLGWPAQLVESVREHSAVALGAQLSGSFRRETQLVGLVGTAEIAVGGHNAWLVEHLELSAGLFVSDALHEGLGTAEWTPLFGLFCKRRQFSCQIDSLIFGRHSLLWSAFAIELQLDVTRVRWSLVGVVREAHGIHHALVVSGTCSCRLGRCQVLLKSLR